MVEFEFVFVSIVFCRCLQGVGRVVGWEGLDVD